VPELSIRRGILSRTNSTIPYPTSPDRTVANPEMFGAGIIHPAWNPHPSRHDHNTRHLTSAIRTGLVWSQNYPSGVESEAHQTVPNRTKHYRKFGPGIIHPGWNPKLAKPKPTMPNRTLPVQNQPHITMRFGAGIIHPAWNPNRTVPDQTSPHHTLPRRESWSRNYPSGGGILTTPRLSTPLLTYPRGVERYCVWLSKMNAYALMTKRPNRGR